MSTVKSKDKESTLTENKFSNNTGSFHPSQLESGIEIFSDNSDNLPEHYYIGPTRDKKGNVTYYSDKAEKFKTKMRLKDFYRILGQNHVCILPEFDQEFEDGIPMFQIFTHDCSD